MLGSKLKIKGSRRAGSGRRAHKPQRVQAPAMIFEQCEPRLMMSATAGSASSVVNAAAASVTATTVSQTPQAGTTLSVTSTGFSISADGGLVKTTGMPFALGVELVQPTLTNGSLIYVYAGWTVSLTPTQDSAGIHFAMQFTNTGATPAVVPDFTLCGLTGNLQNQWASNQTAPLVLDSTLSDGSHAALTVDDINYPIVAEMTQATNPADGTENIYFHPTGGQYTRYDLGLVPVTVAPGGQTSIHASLRFGATTAAVSAATDAAWAQAFPYALDWTDRRQMLRGDMFQWDPTPSNPQGCQCGFDINNPANFGAFESFAMSYAANAIATCKAVNAGTWIEWDLEGKQEGMDYKGNPELIMQMNPGWAQTDGTGVPLITRFFKAFENAGINVGVCIRPWTLDLNSDGSLSVDPNVSGVQSVANHIDYCENTWGIKAFYLDSPQQQQTAAYRSSILARPGTLVIPEDVPESWLQFSAPMVWLNQDIINWVTVPRNIYGNQGWGVYFHQDLTNATEAASFQADAELGSTVLTEGGWAGADQPQLQAAMKLLTAARAAVPAVPVVTVTDAGGVSTGQPFAAAAAASVFGVDLATPSLSYYLGSAATGAALTGAPSAAGTYTVVASVAASAEYPAASAQTTFTISAPVTDATAPSVAAVAAVAASPVTSPTPAPTVSQTTTAASALPPTTVAGPKSLDAQSVFTGAQPGLLSYLGTDSFNMKQEEKLRLRRLRYHFTRPTLPYLNLGYTVHPAVRVPSRKRAA